MICHKPTTNSSSRQQKPISTAFYGWSLNASEMFQLNWNELGQSVPAALEGKLKCAHVTGSLRCFILPKDVFIIPKGVRQM